MNYLRLILIGIGAIALHAGFAADTPVNRHYPVNTPPLRQTQFVSLPLGAINPAGWLRDQLQIQANGLTGFLDEFWPDLLNSAWKGKDGEGWERGPYYLDGLVPLAYVLEDARLMEKSQAYIRWILTSGRLEGWFGPAKNKDRWPLAVAMKVLTQYYEATGDKRVLAILKNYLNYLATTPPDWPDKEWRGVRAMENAVTAYWYYRQTRDPQALQVTASIATNSFDWTGYFLDFPYTTDAMKGGIKHGHPTHVVNIAMATKYPGLWYQQAPVDRYRRAVLDGLQSLDRYHGQAGGRFAGDEHLSGLRPTQGTELCAVVEYMFSLENLLEIFGDTAFADRLEQLAYNANPGACTPDYWAHQYDQQANQVLVSKAKRKWSTNDDTSNLYGLEPNYGCCTANMHQGWPKFVSHLWMATHDQGLVAATFGPCVVRAKVADGAEVIIREETDYPFDGTVRFRISLAAPKRFPLYFRVPAWADGAILQYKNVRLTPSAGSFVPLDQTWQEGDLITLTLPMRLRAETRYNQAVTLMRGPLVFSLKIGEKYNSLKSHHPTFPANDWEITPTTPWNYALAIDRAHPEKSIKVQMSPIARIPFRQESAPVILQVKGRRVPEWQIADNSAGETPTSPVKSTEPLAALELIPYGCTRLRITEFPVLAP
jgi:uncharacterized protein